MFPLDLIEEQPFASRLVSAAIQKNKLAQAYMFTQAPAISQYYFSLELAKLLNCQSKVNDKACNLCTDCKWINNNTHPAVITVSPVDLTTNDKKTAKSKNIITVHQARELRKILSTSSKYYRTVIFVNAVDSKLPVEEDERLWLNFKNRVKPPKIGIERNFWAALHLNKEVLDDNPANTLLKTLEEPLGKTLFTFITKDSDDMISTIVSRCQVLPLKTQSGMLFEPQEYLQEIASFLPPRNELDSIKVAKLLLNFSKTQQIELDKLLDYVEILYKKQLEHFITEDSFSIKTFKDIDKVEFTKRLLKQTVNPQAALVSMLNSLII